MIFQPIRLAEDDQQKILTAFFPENNFEKWGKQVSIHTKNPKNFFYRHIFVIIFSRKSFTYQFCFLAVCLRYLRMLTQEILNILKQFSFYHALLFHNLLWLKSSLVTLSLWNFRTRDNHATPLQPASLKYKLLFCRLFLLKQFLVAHFYMEHERMCCLSREKIEKFKNNFLICVALTRLNK